MLEAVRGPEHRVEQVVVDVVDHCQTEAHVPFAHPIRRRRNEDLQMTQSSDRIGQVEFVNLVTISTWTNIQRRRLRELCVDLTAFDVHGTVQVTGENNVRLQEAQHSIGVVVMMEEQRKVTNGDSALMRLQILCQRNLVRNFPSDLVHRVDNDFVLSDGVERTSMKSRLEASHLLRRDNFSVFTTDVIVAGNYNGLE